MPREAKTAARPTRHAGGVKTRGGGREQGAKSMCETQAHAGLRDGYSCKSHTDEAQEETPREEREHWSRGGDDYVHTDQATLALHRSSSNSTCYKKHDMPHSWLTGYRRASSWAADVCQLPTLDDQ